MAIKTIYTIIGYTHEDFKNSWTSFGAYTTRERAEREIKDIASSVAAGYRSRAKHEPEEYGDMEDCYWDFNTFFGVANVVTTDYKPKHLHLEIRETTLRSGRD